jgi:PAS domain S-box-containing protein
MWRILFVIHEPNRQGRVELSNFFRIIILALVYVALGKASLWLAIPPGYATVVWPPSGVALAAVVVFGCRLWPGVFIGSFLTNASLDPSLASLVDLGEWAFVPAAIAAGAAIQAVAGAFLVCKFAGFPNRLDTEKKAFMFLTWAGPVACVINSVIGTTVLFISGKVTTSDYLFNLGTWWAGDTIGVFIFAPMLLVWLLRPTEEWRPRRMAVTIPTLASFLLTVLVTIIGANFERESLRLIFAQRAAVLPAKLEQILSQYISVLDSAAGLRKVTPDLDRQAFAEFFDRSFGSIGGIQAISWNPVITPDDRDRFENETRAEGYTGFFISERDSDGKLTLAAMRPDYIVVSFIEPFEANKAAHGFDVGSNAVRRQAFEQARDTGRPVATGRITLVQETRKQFGVLVFMPVYKAGALPVTIAERRQRIDGYVVGVLRGGDIVSAALGDNSSDNLAFTLFDDSATSTEQFLFKNEEANDSVRFLNETGLFGGSTEYASITNLEFAGRQWRAEINPTRDFLSQHRSANSWIILSGGMLIAGFVSAFFLLWSGRSALLRELVEDKTRSLSISQKRLSQAQRLASLGNWQWEIEEDSLWWSEELENILGLKSPVAEKSLATLLGFIHPDERSLVADTIARARIDGNPVKMDLRILQPDGTEKIVQLQSEVARDESGHATRVLGTIQDITERKRLDRLKTEFVSNTSHELRTPLTSIKGALGLLSSKAIGPMPEKAVGLLKLADKNADRLINLVNDILDLEKINADRLVLQKEKLDLAEIAKEAVELNLGLEELFSVKLQLGKLMPGAVAHVDRFRIIQVMTNLISNAAKFSPADGTILVSVGHDIDIVTLSVADPGPGIPLDFQTTIFEPFSQADGSATRSAGGTGLGLHISRAIVERHGGKLTFETRAGVGTTFMVQLPMAQDGITTEERTRASATAAT